MSDYWSNRSTFSYRSLPVYAAAFSPDSTLVALAHGTVVTLWNTASNVMVRALESSIDARKIAFVGGEGRYLAVGGAQKGIAVWDLLSCVIANSSPEQLVDVLLALPTGFVAAHSTASATTLALFQPNGQHMRSVHLRAPFSALTALPGMHLVGIAPSGEISRFGDAQAAASPGARAVQAQAPRRTTSIWQEMFGKDAFLDELAPEPEPPAVTELQRRAAGRPDMVFEGPSHTLPPVSMLFDAFMDELLVTRSEGDEAADVDMADADEIAPLAAAPVGGDTSRPVKDEDVDELVEFFTTVLANAPKKAPKPKEPGENGIKPAKADKLGKKERKDKSKANGHRTVSMPASLEDAGSDDDARVVDKTKKKRKAPRASDI